MSNSKIGMFVLMLLVMFSSCDPDPENGSLDLNIKLKYDEKPLVMFEAYEYPDGRSISFNRFSFYISELKLDDTEISNVEYLNLTNANADISASTNGFDWEINEIEPGDYKNLNFLVGVTAENNKKTPGEYDSDSPLANPAEHWFSWNSYIFLKVEGNMDMDGDGERETPIALHLGSDEALRTISLDKEITINSNENTKAEIEIDLYNFFGGTDQTYDIDSNPSIHALGQIDAVVALSNNVPFTFK